MLRNTPSRCLTIAALLALALAGSASADTCFESRTWQEGEGANNAAMIRVEGCVDGPRFGITIIESGNPFMTEKNRLVSENVQDVIYLIDDEKETYSPWDINAVLNAATTIMNSMGPLLKIQVENVQLKTLERAPDTFLGRSVERVKIESSYDIITRVMGLKNQMRVSAVEELWIDHNLDVGFGAWFDREPPDLGGDFNRLYELERQKLGGGVPLKTVRWEVTESKKGKRRSELKTITEITRFAEERAPSGTYTWPDHYTRTETMPSAEQLGGLETAAGEQPEEEEEKKGWRGKLPFGKKKGGG